MITQERVLELYARANPVQDVDELVTDLEAASYLANLQDRSSEMTQLDTRQTERVHTSRRPLFAIAAAAVVILGTVLVLMTRGSEEVVTTTTIAIPTTAPEVIEEQAVRQFLSTRDYSVLDALVTDDWLSTDVDASPYSNRRELMETIWSQWQIIGVERTLVSCEPEGVGAFNCTISYTDEIMKAFDEPPIVEATLFTFVEGKIYSGVPTGKDPISAFSRYAFEAGIQRDFSDACDSGGPSCMQFIMDNLQEWAAWQASGQ